jgi:L-serine dehydratase
MFHSISELVNKAREQSLPLHELVLRSEIEASERERTAVIADMFQRLEVMKLSIQRGLRSPIQSLSGLSRGQAYNFSNWLREKDRRPLSGQLLGHAMANALAVGEVNASMGCIVATPTAGSAGVLPAVLFALQDEYGLPDSQLVEALFTAGGIGAVIMHRAHVSGAAGGCQLETGSAAAMSAGAVVELLGGSPNQASQAVAISLSNMLGLVCDPIAGLVEIPCIQRNAAAVAQCLVAVDLALSGFSMPIPADEVIDAMERIGRQMDIRLRETAEGGLAATPTALILAKEIWNRLQRDEA